MHQYMLGAAWFESRFAEKDLVDTKLTMNHQCTLVTEKADSALDCIRKQVASRLRKKILCLFSFPFSSQHW